jgi:ABC-2 type transport system ATP-binding protein
MSAAEAAIETRALTKRFGDRVALDHVDLSVPAGTAFGFLGPNGAGKTTLIRTLLGLTSATTGEARMLGQPVPDARAQVLARVGAIVEEPRFHDHLSGRRNLWQIAAARDDAAVQRIPSVLDRVGLAERADDRVKTYSLGMRQRLGLARCLLCDPLLLILDEPTNGLDPSGIQEFREAVRTLVEDEGRTVFLSSHLLSEVERICDFAAVVDHGSVIAQGSIAELTGAGAGACLSIEVDDLDAALATLAGHELVTAAHPSDGRLRVTLVDDSDHSRAAMRVNSALVRAGIGVARLEPEAMTLEQKFFALTSADDDHARAEVAR